MKRLIAVAALLLTAACATQESATDAKINRGSRLAEVNCAMCHAVGRTGSSSAPEAPPFRTLSQNYRVSMLEESLAEGISVGHPAMPNFQFSPDDAEALVRYLETIQETGHDAAHPAL